MAKGWTSEGLAKKKRMTSKAPLFGLPLDPRDHHSYHRHAHGSRGVKFLLYACVAILLITCASLAMVVKGAQHANHELRQQLLAEEQRYNRLKQTSAEEKVVIVDAEERARLAEQSATNCRLELHGKSADAEEAGQKVQELDLLLKQAKEEARKCEDRVSRGLGVIDTLTRSS